MIIKKLHTRTRCPPWTNWIKNYTRYHTQREQCDYFSLFLRLRRSSLPLISHCWTCVSSCVITKLCVLKLKQNRKFIYFFLLFFFFALLYTYTKWAPYRVKTHHQAHTKRIFSTYVCMCVHVDENFLLQFSFIITHTIFSLFHFLLRQSQSKSVAMMMLLLPFLSLFAATTVLTVCALTLRMFRYIVDSAKMMIHFSVGIPICVFILEWSKVINT